MAEKGKSLAAPESWSDGVVEWWSGATRAPAAKKARSQKWSGIAAGAISFDRAGGLLQLGIRVLRAETAKVHLFYRFPGLTLKVYFLRRESS